jgi:chromatin remodeling complex protein RSC6
MEPVQVETVAIEQSSTSEQLKTILKNLGEQSSQTKSLMNLIKGILKDVDRQGKELDKLRNKKSRSSGQRKSSGLQSGITKPVSISEELAKFLGVEVGTLVPRNEVTKGVSSYVRKFELSDPTNKQKFVLTSKPEGKALAVLLGNPTEEVTYFNLQRYLKHHYTSVGVAEPATPVAKKVPVEVMPEESAVPETPKKKKVIVVKKKKPELDEE